MEDFKTIGYYEFDKSTFIIQTDGKSYKLITMSEFIYEYPSCLIFKSVTDLNNWIERMDLGIPKIVVDEVVNKCCGFLDDMFNTLLDIYLMEDWYMSKDMSWEEFIEQAKVETIQRMDKWKALKVLEDD